MRFTCFNAKISSVCPHSTCLCLVSFLQQTAAILLVMDSASVYCTVRTELLCLIYTTVSLEESDNVKDAKQTVALSADWQQINAPIPPQRHRGVPIDAAPSRAAPRRAAQQDLAEHRTSISLFPLWKCSLLFIVPALSKHVSWRSVADSNIKWRLKATPGERSFDPVNCPFKTLRKVRVVTSKYPSRFDFRRVSHKNLS